jgi:hypothetical protein
MQRGCTGSRGEGRHAAPLSALPPSRPTVLQGLYKIAGVKGQPVCFIFSDSDVKEVGGAGLLLR